MTKKYLFATLLFVGIMASEVNAQQDAQYTQYMYNTLSVNPAYAGSRGQLSLQACTVRNGWAWTALPKPLPLTFTHQFVTADWVMAFPS